MTDPTPITAMMPCVKRCARKGTEESDTPALLAARHGHYCDRCYYLTEGSLRDAAGLVEHIILLVGGMHSKQNDGSKKLKNTPPLPFNVEAFNDANETYSRLVYWSSLWATRINRQAPGPTKNAWRTDNNRVVGLPADISATAARYAVGVMAGWLSIHLDDIMATQATDDIDYFREDMADIFRLKHKWPTEDEAKYAPVRCPDDACQGRIAIYPPTYFKDDERIMCESCGRIFEKDDYDRVASVFRQVRVEQAKEFQKAARTAARLTKKYGVA